MNDIRLKTYGPLVLAGVVIMLLMLLVAWGVKLPHSEGIEQIDASTVRISQGDTLVLKNGKSYYEFTFDGDQTVVIDSTAILSPPREYILCGVDCELETNAGRLFLGHPTLTLRADDKVDVQWPSGRWWLR